MAVGYEIFVMSVSRCAGTRLSVARTLPNPVNCRWPLFAVCVGGRSGFAQWMMLEGVSWNQRMWVVVNQMMN